LLLRGESAIDIILQQEARDGGQAARICRKMMGEKLLQQPSKKESLILCHSAQAFWENFTKLKNAPKIYFLASPA
jgi:hypothetical protein